MLVSAIIILASAGSIVIESIELSDAPCERVIVDNTTIELRGGGRMVFINNKMFISESNWALSKWNMLVPNDVIIARQTTNMIVICDGI